MTTRLFYFIFCLFWDIFFRRCFFLWSSFLNLFLAWRRTWRGRRWWRWGRLLFFFYILNFYRRSLLNFHLFLFILLFLLQSVSIFLFLATNLFFLWFIFTIFLFFSRSFLLSFYFFPLFFSLLFTLPNIHIKL